MTHCKIASALLVSLSAAACGGSSDTSAPATSAPAISAPATSVPAVSRIFDLTLPADLDRNALPTSAQTALAEFERRNAGVIATGGPPTGNASGMAYFYGTDALALAVEDGALVQGDVLLTANLNSGRIGGQFQHLSITDGSGATKWLDGVIRMHGAEIVNGRFDNVLYTDVSPERDGTQVTGTSEGAFVGDGSEAVGVVNGTITLRSGAPQAFTGGFTADQRDDLTN